MVDSEKSPDLDANERKAAVIQAAIYNSVKTADLLTSAALINIQGAALTAALGVDHPSTAPRMYAVERDLGD